MDKMLNEKTVTVKIKRGDLCDLLLACSALSRVPDSAKKWKRLHDQLKQIVDDFDSKQDL